MQYRRLDKNNDMTFGQGHRNFLVNTPETVAQAVLTRLKLWHKEWFIDSEEGMPYPTKVLGKYTNNIYDIEVKERVLKTQGVIKILFYDSLFNPETRTLTVNITIDTVYGEINLQEAL